MATIVQPSANESPINQGFAARFTVEASKADLQQDVISQFPILNGYSYLAFGFQPEHVISRESIVAALREAAAQVTRDIPLVGQQIIRSPRTDSDADNFGVWTPAPWPSDAPPNELVRVHDCESKLPSMTDLIRADIPISKLDASVITPWPAMPLAHGQQPPWPTTVLQANFLQGGLIITLGMHHMAFDGNGFIQMMRHLATILSGKCISAADITAANIDRRTVIPLLPRDEPIKDHSQFRAPPSYVVRPPASPPKWCYFKLPTAALPALRKLAANSPVSISDNDILCALMWQRITAARIARGVFTADTPTMMTRAIDARSAVGVPLAYMGHLIYFSGATLSMGQVASASLGVLAAALRRALTAANNEWSVRSFATFIAREPDRSRLIYSGVRNLDTDLGATSFVAVQGNDNDGASGIPDDFGPLLGKLKFTRRPNVSPLPGGITIAPAERGAIPLALCLPEADLEALKKDAEWRRYTRYIG